MPAPYTVTYAEDGSGYTYHTTHAHLRDAIESARNGRDRHGEHVSIHGEGYDCDCDQDGYFVCSTGLTEFEEELIESELDRDPLDGRVQEVPVPVCAFSAIRGQNGFLAIARSG